MFFAVALLAAHMHLWLPVSDVTELSEADSQPLSSMFDTPSDVAMTSNGMMVVSPQVRMVMLVRRAEDGSLVTACVTSAEQAEAFLRPKARIAPPNEVRDK